MTGINNLAKLGIFLMIMLAATGMAAGAVTFGNVETSPASPTDDNQPIVNITDVIDDSGGAVNASTINVLINNSSDKTEIEVMNTSDVTGFTYNESGNENVSLNLTDYGEQLSDNTFDVIISAKNETDDSNSTTFTDAFTIDTTAPSVTDVQITDDTDNNGIVTNGDKVEIKANVTDTNTIESVTTDASAFGAGSNLELKHDSGDLYNATFTVGSSGVSEDGQSLTITAEDSAGNINDTETSETILIDTTAPTLDSASKHNDTAINVTISDGGSGIDNASIGIDDFNLTPGIIGTVDSSYVTDGSTNPQIVQIDLGNPVDSDSVIVELNSSNDGIKDLAGNVNNSGSTTADNMDSVAPTIHDSGLIDETDENGNVSDGDKVIVYANVTDGSGINSVSADMSNFSGASSVSLTTETNANFDWDDDDNKESDVYGANVTVNESKSSVTEGTGFSANITVTDTSSNSNTLTGVGSMVVDFTAPSVTNVQITDVTDGNGIVTNGDTVKINATVTESNTIKNVTTDASVFGAGTIELDTTDSNTYNTTFQVGSSGTSEGSQTLSIEAEDLAGNIDSNTSGTINVDTTAPELDSVSKFDLKNISVLITDNVDVNESTIEKSDFNLNVGSIDSLTTSESGSNATVDIKLTNKVDSDKLDVNISSGGTINDTTRNQLTDTASAVSVSGMDGVAPILDGASKHDDTTINVTISDGGRGIDKASIGINDFNLTPGRIGTVDSSYVDDGATTSQIVQIDLRNPVDSDTVNVELNSSNDGIKDKAGNSNNSGLVTADNMDGVEPTINEFKVTNPDVENQNVTIEINSSEQLNTISVDLDIDDKGDETTLDMSNFTESGEGPYVYTATYEGTEDGTYNATLTTASDSAGNNGASSQYDTAVVGTTAPTIYEIIATNTESQNVTIEINSSEQLDTISVDLNLDNSDEATLDQTNFTETKEGPNYIYNTTYEGSSDGEYNATLTTAKDTADNDGASNQFNTAVVDTTGPSIEYAVINNSMSDKTQTFVTVKFDEAVTAEGSATIKAGGHELSFNTAIDSKTLLFNKTDTLIDSKDDNITSVSNVEDDDGNSATISSDVEIDAYRKTMSANDWNYVSFPIADDSTTSVSDVMETSKEYTVWKYHNGEWKVYKPGDVQEFNDVEGGLGYMVNAKESFTLAPNVETVYDNENTALATVKLYEGWNLIGSYEEYNSYSGTTSLQMDTYYYPYDGSQNSISTGQVLWVSFSELSGGSANYNAGTLGEI